jgi:hypothetical protein
MMSCGASANRLNATRQILSRYQRMCRHPGHINSHRRKHTLREEVEVRQEDENREDDEPRAHE